MARIMIGMALALVLGQGAWGQDAPRPKVAPDGTIELELQVVPKDAPRTDGKVKVQLQVVPPTGGIPNFPPMEEKDLQQLLKRIHQQREAAQNQGSNKEVIELLRQIIHKLEGHEKSAAGLELRMHEFQLLRAEKDSPELAKARAEVAEAEKRLAEARAKVAKLQAPGPRTIIKIAPDTGRPQKSPNPDELEQRLNRLTQEIEELRRAIRKNEK